MQSPALKAAPVMAKACRGRGGSTTKVVHLTRPQGVPCGPSCPSYVGDRQDNMFLIIESVCTPYTARAAHHFEAKAAPWGETGAAIVMTSRCGCVTFKASGRRAWRAVLREFPCGIVTSSYGWNLAGVDGDEASFTAEA